LTNFGVQGTEIGWRSFLGRYSTGSKHTGRLRQQEFLPVNDLIRVQLKLLA
jgi:hypothetical protein